MKKNRVIIVLGVVLSAFVAFNACDNSEKEIVNPEESTEISGDLVIVTDANIGIGVEEDNLISDFPNAIMDESADKSQALVTTIDDVIVEEAEEEFEFDLITDELLDDLLDEVIDGMLKSAEVNVCPSIEVTRLNNNDKYPRVITKTFVDSCENKWGKTRSGVIVITDYQNPNTVGAIRTVELHDFTLGNTIFNGVKTIENEGASSDSEIIRKVKGAIVIEKANGVFAYRIINIKRYINKVRDEEGALIERLTGLAGQVSVIKSNGIAFKMKIKNKSMIRRSNKCKWPISGTKEFVFFKNPEEIEKQVEENMDVFGNFDLKILSFKKDYLVTINYGDEDATCDRVAIKTIDDNEPIEILLRK